MSDRLFPAPMAPTMPPKMPPEMRPSEPQPFIDAATGAIDVKALLAAYTALEARLARLTAERPSPPDSPDGYAIDCQHGYFDIDPDINRRLHGAGFTPEQAQLVYDLAAERMIPMIQGLAAEFHAEREMDRLVQHFGGADKWREVSRQLTSWAKRNLPPDAVEGLASTYDGVMALYRLMRGGEPATMPKGGGGGDGGAMDEAGLHTLMRDPRYWRDRDQGLINRVTDGFRRLYPNG